MHQIFADIQAADFDVVVLQEVTRQNEHVLETLRDDFPFVHSCRLSGRSGISLMSRHPFAGDPLCSHWRAVLAAPITEAGKRLWMESVHIPWPFDTAENETAAMDVLSNLDGRVVIADDFNLVAWSGRVERIASLPEISLAGPARPSLFLWAFPLPIDLTMAPGGGTVPMRPQFSSRHFGIVADLVV